VNIPLSLPAGKGRGIIGVFLEFIKKLGLLDKVNYHGTYNEAQVPAHPKPRT